MIDIDSLKFDASGLIPCIIQDDSNGSVLMLGYASRETLQETSQHGFMVFFSRPRNSRWLKGETSGNTLKVISMKADCDSDALLVRVQPTGPTCHTGSDSCFEVGN